MVVDYSTLIDGVGVVQVDELTGKVFVAYADIVEPTDTVFECLVINSAITVENSTTLSSSLFSRYS